MSNPLKRLLSVLLLMSLCATGQAHTREAVREAWAQVSAEAASPYACAPLARAPYEAGELSAPARSEALRMLNFARWLAGLEAVSESAIYDYQCQHGAVLLAALDYVDHDAPRPGDMEQNFYDSAHIATASSNVARFNWMRETILREGVEYFLRDDGDANLPTLGHRRWALNPQMAATGFGLANSESGMSYVLMYAHDLGNPDVPWESVAWPAPGCFPAELMHRHLAWSVVLNPQVYDLAASAPRITLSEPEAGLTFYFDPALPGDGDCAFNLEGYGPGPCLIFRPDFSGLDFTDYQQNQRWHVRVDGLVDRDGLPRPLDYQVDMVSLVIQDVFNVELTPQQAALAPGDTLLLSAAVIPAYADDLVLAFLSSDPSVATVSPSGLVTALAPGEATITARSANGCEDVCRVEVRD